MLSLRLHLAFNAGPIRLGTAHIRYDQLWTFPRCSRSGSEHLFGPETTLRSAAERMQGRRPLGETERADGFCKCAHYAFWIDFS